MFQIEDLQAALDALGERVPGLEASVEWANEGITVNYMVDFQGHEVCSREPIPVHDAPRQIADEVCTALGTVLPKEELEALVKDVRETSVRFSM